MTDALGGQAPPGGRLTTADACVTTPFVTKEESTQKGPKTPKMGAVRAIFGKNYPIDFLVPETVLKSKGVRF